jgi:hypothetical protein
MISIRGGAGIGDALYLQSVARHFVEKGEAIEACCDWPDVFRPLAGKVKVSPFRRKPIDRLAHYSARRAIAGTTQFEDCCIQAGIRDRVDLRLDWQIVNVGLVEMLRATGKPIVVVQLPRAPFGRTDGFGKELLPDCRRIQDAIDRLSGRAFLVQVGKGAPWFQFEGIDLDLVDRTSVAEMIDIGLAADAFLGYVSFIVPLAESFSKPALLVWSRAGLNSRHEVIRTIQPQKILHGPLSRWVMDDCSSEHLRNAVDALCDEIGRKVAA